MQPPNDTDDLWQRKMDRVFDQRTVKSLEIGWSEFHDFPKFENFRNIAKKKGTAANFNVTILQCVRAKNDESVSSGSVLRESSQITLDDSAGVLQIIEYRTEPFFVSNGIRLCRISTAAARERGNFIDWVKQQSGKGQSSSIDTHVYKKAI